MIVVNPATRQFNIPGADLVFGVTDDASSEVKHFQCSRYVGNNLDIASSFVRINYQNANGEIDSYLVQDLSVDGNNILFSWELTKKVTMYKGNLSFVMCVVGPDTKVKWHTTLGRGQVLEGLEPDSAMIEQETADVVAQLIALVEAQTAVVEKTGADQVAVVKAAAKTAQDSAVAEIEAKRVNSLASIPADYTALSATVDTLIREAAPGIVCPAEGEVITLNDASDNYLSGLRIFGRSTQDGIPTPENPVEIESVGDVGVTVIGKNLLNISSRINFTKAHQKEVFIPKGTYVVSCGVTISSGDNQPVIGMFDASGARLATVNLVSDKAETITFRNDIVRVYIYSNGWSDSGSAGVDATIEQLMISKSGGEYEPYNEQTLAVNAPKGLPGIPVTSGGNYTDANGQQWVGNIKDFEYGMNVQMVTEAIFDGDEGWVPFGAYNGLYRYYCLVSDVIATGAMADQRVMSSAFPTISVTAWSLVTNQCIALHPSDKTINLFVPFATVDEFKAYLAENPMSVIYQIAIPIETPLSEIELAAYRALHTNKPNTTILNDSGAHMKVEYTADTKLYIDNKLAALVGNN